jgi:DNA polymerase/3'-5' exonuclease PolX
MLDTGTFKAFEEIRHTIPQDIEEIIAMQGIGLKPHIFCIANWVSKIYRDCSRLQRNIAYAGYQEWV